MTRSERLFIAGISIVLLVGGIAVFGLVSSDSSVRADTVSLPWTNPPDYTIVYLLPPETDVDEQLMSKNLETTLGAQTVYTWSELRSLEASRSLDALIIHAAALPKAESQDQEWVANLYNDGVVVALFNAYAPDLADLVNDHCIAEDEFASEPYADDFYVLAYRLVLGQSDDLARVKEAYAESCGEEPAEGVEHRTRLSRGRATHAISNTSDFNIFANVLANKVEGIKQTKQEFQMTPNGGESR